MKVYLIAIASILIFTSFFLFSVSHDTYMRNQEEVKMAANDAAHGAALYYETQAYGLGIKIYDKAKGNAVIDKILSTSLSEPPVNVCTYYFDENAQLTVYKNKVQIETKKIDFPYEFLESRNEYQKTVNHPTVIVTIEMEEQPFYVPWIRKAQLIRTSAYEDQPH